MQVVDTAEGHVIEQHHVDFLPFLNRRCQLGVQHHVRAIADKGVHLALRLGQLDPQRRVHFIAHARVAIFHVIGIHPFAAPCPLQVTGQAASGRHNNCVVCQRAVEHAQHLALGQAGTGQLDKLAQHGRVHVVTDFRGEVRLLIVDLIHPVDFGLQLRPGLLRRVAPARPIAARGQRLAQRFKPRQRIGNQLHAIEFECVAGADVEVEKLHFGVLEQRLG